MRIAIVGGGPAGLYFAILAKRLDPAHDVRVYERNAADNTESKVYLSKKLLQEVLDKHRSARTVVQVPV